MPYRSGMDLWLRKAMMCEPRLCDVVVNQQRLEGLYHTMSTMIQFKDRYYHGINQSCSFHKSRAGCSITLASLCQFASSCKLCACTHLSHAKQEDPQHSEHHLPDDLALYTT